MSGISPTMHIDSGPGPAGRVGRRPGDGRRNASWRAALGALVIMILVAIARVVATAPDAPATFQDCDVCPEMQVVPSGEFMIGSSAAERAQAARAWGADAQTMADQGQQHRVTIGYRLAVGRHEVTRGEFAAFVAETGHTASNECRVPTFHTLHLPGSDAVGSTWLSTLSWRSPGFAQDSRHPVVCVSWDDAQAYVAWVSGKTGETYRLLTEAEWEYVARAGTPMTRYWGSDWRNERGCKYANMSDSAGDASCADDGSTHTAPVGSYRANHFGLHDMIGNAWEWVADCYGDSYSGAPADGAAVSASECAERTVRGGGWISPLKGTRVAMRAKLAPDDQANFVGFRVARNLPDDSVASYESY